jgi:chorismate dehydratase
MADKFKIGEIRYANCTPLYSTLKAQADCSGYEFVPGEPAALNALLAEGSIDASSSSSVEYARHWREYLIVPDISISSAGEVGSILLFTSKPVEKLGGEKVAVSSASATSTVLLKALLKFRYGVVAKLLPREPVLGSMLDGTSAALLIGDEALKERKALGEGSGLQVYDLGRLWQDFTGLPFVYALWMVREDSAKRLPGLAMKFKTDILGAKEAAVPRLDEIAADAPESSWMGAAELALYWKAMSYDLDERHKRGLMEFFTMAHGVGEVAEVPALRFL